MAGDVDVGEALLTAVLPQGASYLPVLHEYSANTEEGPGSQFVFNVTKQ